jgi:hypothetical protein
MPCNAGCLGGVGFVARDKITQGQHFPNDSPTNMQHRQPMSQLPGVGRRGGASFRIITGWQS